MRGTLRLRSEQAYCTALLMREAPAKDKAREMRALSFYLPAGTGLGCGFLPLDSFFLSLLPMMFSCLVFRLTRRHPS
jgi:hypothetical protein